MIAVDHRTYLVCSNPPEAVTRASVGETHLHQVPAGSEGSESCPQEEEAAAGTGTSSNRDSCFYSVAQRNRKSQ